MHHILIKVSRKIRVYILVLYEDVKLTIFCLGL